MPPELVIRTDRRAINRWNGGIVGVQVALVAFVVVIMGVVGRLVQDVGVSLVSLAPFLILLLGQVFQLGFYCYVWGARVAISRPLTITPVGVVLDLPQGRAEIGWEAIARVELRSVLFGKLLVFRLHPAAVDGAPAVRTEVAPKVWNRYLRRGILLGQRGLDHDLPTIRAALAQASAGRVLV